MQTQQQRPILFVRFDDTFTVSIGTSPTPLQANPNRNDYITSFLVSVPSTAANNIFIGGQGVAVGGPGQEIIAGGGPVNFFIQDQFMRYELQLPLIAIAETLRCKEVPAFTRPIQVFDLSAIYGIAAAATTVSITPFREQFV